MTTLNSGGQRSDSLASSQWSVSSMPCVYTCMYVWQQVAAVCKHQKEFFNELNALRAAAVCYIHARFQNNPTLRHFQMINHLS